MKPEISLQIPVKDGGNRPEAGNAGWQGATVPILLLSDGDMRFPDGCLLGLTGRNFE